MTDRGRPQRSVAAELVPHLRRARDHIDRYYATSIDLDALAQVAGVSKYHFARCFQVTYGETPIRYLTRRRIERAQDLLRAANLTVTEVCIAVGFASLGSFSARFRALTGETPVAYRDRWAARGGAHVPGCWLFMRGVLDPGGTSAGASSGGSAGPGSGGLAGPGSGGLAGPGSGGSAGPAAPQSGRSAGTRGAASVDG